MENTISPQPNNIQDISSVSSTQQTIPSSQLGENIVPVESSKKSSKFLAVIGVILVFLIVSGAGAYYLFVPTVDPVIPVVIPPSQTVACTEEAKICPDGSAVGRVGLSCEFEDCPGDITELDDWKNLEDTNLGFKFSYPNDLVVFNTNRTAGKQQVLYELSRSNLESEGDSSSGVYFVSYFPDTNVDSLFEQFDESVYVSNDRTQMVSNGQTMHVRRTVAADGPGAGIETMLVAVDLKGGVLTFDLVSNGPTREQDAELLETILNTIVIE